jgi:hypothetical protein
VTAPQLHQSFWTSFLNTTFLSKYPKAKLFNFFEYIKVGEDQGVTRDYRISIDPAIWSTFQAALQPYSSKVVSAGVFVPGKEPLCINNSSCSSSSSGSTTTVNLNGFAPTGTTNNPSSDQTTKSSSSSRSTAFASIHFLFFPIFVSKKIKK